MASVQWEGTYLWCPLSLHPDFAMKLLTFVTNLKHLWSTSEAIILCLRRRRNIASIFFKAEFHNLETSLSWRIDLRLQTTTQCDCQAASNPLLCHNDKNRVETHPDFTMKLLTFVTNLKHGLRRRQNIVSIFCSAKLHKLKTSLSCRSDLRLQTTTQCDCQAASKPLLRHKKLLWNSKKDSQREWLLVIPLLTVWKHLSHSTLHSFVKLFTYSLKREEKTINIHNLFALKSRPQIINFEYPAFSTHFSILYVSTTIRSKN